MLNACKKITHKKSSPEDRIGVGELCRLIDIQPSHLEYWRRELDPNPKRKYFYDSQVFAYTVIKILIRYSGLQVTDLQELGMEFIFKGCEINQNELSKLMFVVDYIDPNILLIKGKGELPKPRMSYELAKVAMDEVMNYVNDRRSRQLKDDQEEISYKDFLVNQGIESRVA